MDIFSGTFSLDFHDNETESDLCTVYELNSVTCASGASVDMNVALQKVRKIVKMFKKSPLKNEMLQKYVSSAHSKEKMLVLDSKTRWNSLLAMVERFLEVKSAIIKSLVDLKVNCELSRKEFAALENLEKVLQPVKLGAEKLCNREATLLTTEAVLNFMCSELRKQNTLLAKSMLDSLNSRMSSQSNKELLSVSLYLKYGKKFNSRNIEGVPHLLSKSSVMTNTKQLYVRLYCTSRLSTSASNSSAESTDEEARDTNLTHSEILNKIVEQCSSESRSTGDTHASNESHKHFYKGTRYF